MLFKKGGRTLPLPLATDDFLFDETPIIQPDRGTALLSTQAVVRVVGHGAGYAAGLPPVALECKKHKT